MASAPRLVTVAAAQMGPNQMATPRSEILGRIIKLLDDAVAAGAKLIVFPELALTAFFAVHLLSEPELVEFMEPESAADPQAIVESARVKPLFDRVKEHGVDIYIGYAERWTDEAGKTTDYNTSIYYSGSEGRVLAKYRKIHLPGTKEPLPGDKIAQQMEKRYFTPGNLGFQAFRAPGLVSGAIKADSAAGQDAKALEGKGDPILGMILCNDRRWPEAWRSYGLQGVEIMLQGYNTTAWAPQYPGNFEEQEKLALMHHHISLQGGSYTNACFSINAGKAGTEDGGYLIGGSCIYDPDGFLLAETKTKEDELLVATIDLAKCRRGKERVFNFDKHRRPEHYGRLVEQVGVQEPPLL
ncbi:n-carbamyl-d-amino acid amidohydrolase [Thozetella sp. PMI_491]|nr:n-carbamyl-d-amino acid amidohydrolase [Thozetella sp. PMI_491]